MCTINMLEATLKARHILVMSIYQGLLAETVTWCGARLYWLHTGGNHVHYSPGRHSTFAACKQKKTTIAILVKHLSDWSSILWLQKQSSWSHPLCLLLNGKRCLRIVRKYIF